MKNGRKHVVFVVADRLVTVDLGIIEDVADLFGNLASRIPYRDKVTLDLAVSGLVDAKAGKSDDGVNRSS